jgi:endonuclease-3
MLSGLGEVHGQSRFIPRFSPMDELISCMLSQHTTDVNSFPAFAQLLVRYPEWEQVVAAPWEEVAETIRFAGLANNKAKSIQAALRKIKEDLGEYSLEPLRAWKTADALAWLQTLPGVGPKTASIVMCFAFGRESIPVDTHVYRVSWRLGLIPEGSGELKAHQLLPKKVGPDHAFSFHTLLIQHGRKVCKAPLPQCDQCPLTSQCRWFEKAGPAKRAAQLKRKRSQPRKLRVEVIA